MGHPNKPPSLSPFPVLICSLLCSLSIALSPNPTYPYPTTSVFSTETENRCETGCFQKTSPTEETITNFICGSDGFTYLNFEEMDCVRKSCRRDIRLWRYGRCPRNTWGSKSNRPNQLRRYHSKLSNSNADPDFLQFLSQADRQASNGRNGGAAGQSLSFPVESVVEAPVQEGSNGNKGTSMGVLGTGKGHQSRTGKEICIPDECNCPSEFRPLCGSDAITYGNECLMECNKKCNPDVIKYHEGHCGKPFGKNGCSQIVSPSDCSCPDNEANLQPVCGSDNVTYWNRCLLECNKNCSPDLEYNHDGYCGKLFFQAVVAPKVQ